MPKSNGQAMVLDEGLAYIDGEVYFKTDRITQVIDKTLARCLKEGFEDVDKELLMNIHLGCQAFAVAFKYSTVATAQDVKEQMVVALSELNN